MLAERTVDFAAAGRVAKYAELKGVHLTHVSANGDPTLSGAFEPTVDHDCTIVSRDGTVLKVSCNYRFSVRTAQVQVAAATIQYLLIYELSNPAPLSEEDLPEFAFANGTLHSWPFVREFLYSLTARMGYPPYTLPSFHFKPKVKAKKEAGDVAPSAPGTVVTKISS